MQLRMICLKSGRKMKIMKPRLHTRENNPNVNRTKQCSLEASSEELEVFPKSILRRIY